MGTQIIIGSARFREPGYRNTIWNSRLIEVFLEVQRISDRSTFLAIQYDRWAALLPTASKSTTNFRDYNGSAFGARFTGADRPLFIAFNN